MVSWEASFIYLSEKPKTMKGSGLSSGIATGKALIIRRKEPVSAVRYLENEGQKADEIKSFDLAVEAAVNEIRKIIEVCGSNFRPDDISILETQTEFIADSQLRNDVADCISMYNMTAVSAVRKVTGEMAKTFGEINDEYLRARVTDIQDAGNRIVRYLLRGEEYTVPIKNSDTILVTEDITPTEALTLDSKLICGILTAEGGRTSHAAIIARSRGIPAVGGCGPEIMSIPDNETVIIDGTSGEVLINPSTKTIKDYEKRKKDFDSNAEMLRQLRDKPAITKDGVAVALYGNISSFKEIENLTECGGEGVGLLRTELFFMTSEDFPGEEEQFEFYLQAAIAAGKKPVIIRTLDIGGDKQLPYFPLPAESNPFLGYRAIRISLDRQELFLTQVMAILRASMYGNLKIMLPMISGINELREAKEIINIAKSRLAASGKRFRENIETGIMLEIPSAAMMTGLLAREADFFSIGTNDLCQYTMAVDRMNSKVAGLYDHFNPGFLRLVATAVEQAHQHGKPVGMCGEMASDPLAVPLLIGMGLREFSMPASSIPVVKQIINSCSAGSCEKMWKKVMRMDKQEDIRLFLKNEMK